MIGTEFVRDELADIAGPNPNPKCGARPQAGCSGSMCPVMNDESRIRPGTEAALWKWIDQLLEQALELKESERALLVEKACGGDAKLLDFGLAKLKERVSFGPDESTATVQSTAEEGKIVGAVAYISPEQAEGKKVHARSDIFSLGAVLYEMTTGHRVFEGDSKLSTLSAILRQELKPIGVEPRFQLT